MAGINLRLLRNARGISQQQLADHMETTQQTIHAYEHGITEPDIGMLVKLSRYFNVSVDYLIDDTKNPELKETTSKELLLIEKFRGLPPVAQEGLLKFIDQLVYAFDHDSD